jgi:two-component system alkaline phosphatase synthesis response regulator PhoP
MAKRISVLVIDDDAEFQELVEMNLQLTGFSVMQALNGPVGLEIAKNEQPDVILLDTTMPGMNGLQVLSELKYDKKTKKIPVFMLTAKTLVGDIEFAFEVGADDYITKPVELRQLGKIIKQKLKKLSKRFSIKSIFQKILG